jgi:hypothetical protein
MKKEGVYVFSLRTFSTGDVDSILAATQVRFSNNQQQNSKTKKTIIHSPSSTSSTQHCTPPLVAVFVFPFEFSLLLFPPFFVVAQSLLS